MQPTSRGSMRDFTTATTSNSVDSNRLSAVLNRSSGVSRWAWAWASDSAVIVLLALFLQLGLDLLAVDDAHEGAVVALDEGERLARREQGMDHGHRAWRWR